HSSEEGPTAGFDHLVVKFEDGTELVLENALIEEEKVEFEERLPNVGLKKIRRTDYVVNVFFPPKNQPELASYYSAAEVSAEERKGVQGQEMFRMPKVLGRGPIPGIKFGFSPETGRLVLVFEPYNHIQRYKSDTPSRAFSYIPTDLVVEQVSEKNYRARFK